MLGTTLDVLLPGCVTSILKTSSQRSKVIRQDFGEKALATGVVLPASNTHAFITMTVGIPDSSLALMLSFTTTR
jgi:hypothetical protein